MASTQQVDTSSREATVIEHSASITLVRRGKTSTRGEYGNFVNSDERVTIDNVGVAWGTESTNESHGILASRTITFYLPPNTHIDPNDRVEFQGVTWKPEGFSSQWQRPISFSFVQPGTVITCSREEQGVNNGK